MSRGAIFDPAWIFRVLAKHQVAFVLVGALAARLQGFSRHTADADLTPDPSPENLDRLAAALRELDARVFTDSEPAGLPFDCTGRSLGRVELWNLITAAGRVDLIFRPAGTAGYAELRKDSLLFESEGAPIHAASLSAILRSKEAAGRPQDRQDAQFIRDMLAADRNDPPA